MLFCINLNLGLPQSTLQFDNSISFQLIQNIIYKFNIKKEEIKLEGNPLVFISTKEPEDIQKWYKKNLKDIEYLIQYTKEQNGILKFYYKLDINKQLEQRDIIKITVLITYSLLVSNMLRYNILYIHGVLTSKGDIFFGPSYCGKTTLAHRLFFNNRYNRALVSDGIVLNFENQNMLYPIPEIWLFGKVTIFDQNFKQNKGYKLRNIYQLLKGQREEIKKENKNKWIKAFIECNKTVFNIPFAYERGTSYQKQKQKWIDCGEGMREKIQRRYQQLINKFIQNNQLKYLAFSANSTDYNLKVKNIQDQI